jgi:molybdopterin-guanine dinucleotide biosynthesis protein B
MPPIVLIVGYSASGKTTLLAGLVRELSGKGYRIGTIKHAPRGFDLPEKGKDNFKHFQAGATASLVSSPQGLWFLRRTAKEPSLQELVHRNFGEMDLILAEGFKNEPRPRIEVLTPGKPLVTGNKDLLLALVGRSRPPKAPAVPFFKPGETVKIARLLEEQVLNSGRKEAIHIFLDGKHLPMNHFVKTIVKNGVTGMVSSLRGVQDYRELLLFLGKGKPVKDGPGEET